MKVINELLGYPKYKIVQDPDKFNFSIDSMLLASFATITSKTKNIVDFCTGNGPIPMFLTLRTNNKITGIELQKESYDLAVESLKLNNLEDIITLINGDVKDILQYVNPSSVDLITCNPPFFKVDETSNLNKNDALTIARHEVCLTLDDVCSSANKVLKDGGYLAMVHRPERLSDIFNTFSKYHLYPSRIRFVYPKEGTEANHVLIEARKGSNKNSNLHILPPLVVYDNDNKWTDEVLGIYNYGMK